MRMWLVAVLFLTASASADAKTDPFYQAWGEANSKVKTAYASFAYGEVVTAREAFLKDWAEKAPADGPSLRYLKEAREEIAAAKILDTAWKKVEKAPEKHLISFLKVRAKADVRRRYSEAERHGLYDLLQQVRPEARKWTADRFPAVITGGDRLEPQDLDNLRSQLMKFFGEYEWKLSTNAGKEKNPRVMKIDATLETPRSLSKVLGRDFGGMQSFPLSVRASFEEDGAQIDSYTISATGMGISKPTGISAACRSAAKRLRKTMADSLITAATRDEL